MRNKYAFPIMTSSSKAEINKRFIGFDDSVHRSLLSPGHLIVLSLGSTGESHGLRDVDGILESLLMWIVSQCVRIVVT